jgi:hypothetical protein
MPRPVPVLVIGTPDGAGDRLAERLGLHPTLTRIPRSRLLVDLAVAIDRNQPALAVYGMPEQYWRSAVAAFFDGLQHDHATRSGKARWVAFLHSSSLTVGELDRLFPTAQFVHVITRPRGGSGRVVSANRRDGARLLPGRYLEVPEDEMIMGAEECAGRVLRFLGEEGDGRDVEVGEPEVMIDLSTAQAAPGGS